VTSGVDVRSVHDDLSPNDRWLVIISAEVLLAQMSIALPYDATPGSEISRHESRRADTL